jgi:phage tail P2-like protein
MTDESLIDEMAWQFHVDFFDPDVPLSMEVRRELAANSLDWHTRKGTPSVLEEIVKVVFEIHDAKILEWFEYGGRPYTFRIETEITNITARRIGHLIAAIFSVKNTRSWLEGIDIRWSADLNLYAGMAVAQEIKQRVEMRAYTEIAERSTHYHAAVVHITPIAFIIPRGAG